LVTNSGRKLPSAMFMDKNACSNYAEMIYNVLIDDLGE
jgi:hypothetical protein